MKYQEIKRAVIEINASCNYSCNFCPQPVHKDFLKTIEINEFKRLVDELIPLGLELVQLEGSGEATLKKDLQKYIQYLTDNNIKSNVYSNGLLMKGQFMKDCVDAGLTLFRFSVIGYDEETYFKNTNTHNFNKIIQNIKEMQEYTQDKNTKISTYHLAYNEYEVSKYLKNIVKPLNVLSEIWKYHNWAGKFNTMRRGTKKTCGRPLAPEITIRAGGIKGRSLAVMPCCQTLGQGDSILSYCDNQKVLEAFNSEKYQWLRKMHKEEKFNEISFCKDCDFLLEDEVLLWSNYAEKYKMNGLNFNL